MCPAYCLMSQAFGVRITFQMSGEKAICFHRAIEVFHSTLPVTDVKGDRLLSCQTHRAGDRQFPAGDREDVRHARRGRRRGGHGERSRLQSHFE